MNAARNYEQISFIGNDFDRQQIRQVKKSYNQTLRERAIESGSFDTMTEKETLSVLLGLTRGSADAAELADDLLNAFGSLKGVLEARPEQLQKIEGMNVARVEMIALQKPLFRMWNRIMMDSPKAIRNSREAENYCLSLLAGERIENFYVVALNAQCKILGARRISTGSLSEVSAYPRLVVETALNYNAHSVLLTHNHPGGTCAPSAEDVASTIQLQQVLQGIDILVLDHIVVANDRTYSMIQHGDIDYRIRKRH